MESRRSGSSTKGEAEVGFKGLIAATAAVALMAAPTVAAAQSVEVAPASETVSEGSELRGGFIIPLIALIAIILGVLAATNDDDDDLPTSP
jgi:glycerol uptake facilitator-like aquaporin